jgi:hypothetical protein
VREVEHPTGHLGPEASEDVAHRQRVAGGGHVGPLLHDDAVRPLAHLIDEPLAHAPMRRAPRDAGAELELGRDVAVGLLAVEGGFRAVGAGGEQGQGCE